MKNLIFVGSHLGYSMDRTPLGGGAMVGLELVRQWTRDLGAGDASRLTVLGSGSLPPAEGVVYVQAPGGELDLVRMSALEYARFCRDFEAATTDWLAAWARTEDPRESALIVNDISESPDLDAAARLGYPIVSLWHVDVVDFFNRFYLGGLLAPGRLTGLFARLEDLGLAGLVPDVLRLVFQKQRRAVNRSSLLVMPSRPMGETLRACYPALDCGRIMVTPWGFFGARLPEETAALEAARLRRDFQIKPDSRVVMTLSRISPEKGILHLIEALELIENSPRLADADVCLFVCGEAAFMGGEAYARRVRRAAERLVRIRVFFPGYLSAFEKAAYFRLANLFVSPSLHESYGLTIVEAMSAGLPVLSSDHHGSAELLKPDYGRTVEAADEGMRSRKIAAALAELLADPRELAMMGARARKAAEDMDFAATARRVLAAALALPARGGA